MKYFNHLLVNNNILNTINYISVNDIGLERRDELKKAMLYKILKEAKLEIATTPNIID